MTKLRMFKTIEINKDKRPVLFVGYEVAELKPVGKTSEYVKVCLDPGIEYKIVED